MLNIMEHDGIKARIMYDQDIDLFRGEILGLSGSADFYADNIKSLNIEFKKSLEMYLEVCQERGIEPFKNYNGKISYRTNSDIHSKLELVATSKNISINKLLDEIVIQKIQELIVWHVKEIMVLLVRIKHVYVKWPPVVAVFLCLKHDSVSDHIR